MKSSNEERNSFGIATLLAILANLIVVIQFVGDSLALGVVAVLTVWGVGLAYGRRILDWLVRYRRDLLFLALGGVLASAGIGGVLLSHGEAATPPCPPPVAPTPCSNTEKDPGAVAKQSPTPPPPQSPGSQSEVVYRTPSGKRYHRATCHHVRSNPNATALTIGEAKKQGLTPCQTCNPPP